MGTLVAMCMAVRSAILGPNRGIGLRCSGFLGVFSLALIRGPLTRPLLVLLKVLVLVFQDGKRTQELSVAHILGGLAVSRRGIGERGSTSVHSAERPAGGRRHVGSSAKVVRCLLTYAVILSYV